MKYALPFGTFLAMGAALAATVGPGILLDWYLGYGDALTRETLNTFPNTCQ